MKVAVGLLRWLGARTPAAGDSRGAALLMATFASFALGMMLFAFLFLIQSDAWFAATNRNSMQALAIAEAGAQEAYKRLATFGLPPNTCTGNNNASCVNFPNSLAQAASGSGTMYYQLPLQSNPAVFPILSSGSFGGAMRFVRTLVQAAYKPGWSVGVYGPLVQFSGNSYPEWSGATPPGDTYSMSSVSFAQYTKSPLCAAGATATNLISPQVLAGTTLSSGSGPAPAEPCTGSTTNTATGPFTTECADGSVTEVAPTACTGHGGRASGLGLPGTNTLPLNWHPMTPIGMSSADFTTLVTWVKTFLPGISLPPGVVVSASQATRNGVGATYTPTAGGYTPSYWSALGLVGNPVMVAYTNVPLCVNPNVIPIGPSSVTVLPAAPFICPVGGHYYGNATVGVPPVNATRFIDWGLVADDLRRSQAQTFYQPPTCTTCNGGGPNGNQNGIRYIPLLPAVGVAPTFDVLSLACLQNISPGTNVFDNAIGDPSVTCAHPPTTTQNTTNVTFSGTKGNPEFLVVDNGAPGGTIVSIQGAGTGGADCTTDPTGYSWGIIMATGDLTFSGNLVFTGFVYTPGTISASGTVVFRGGVYAANIIGTTQPPNTLTSTGNVTYCAGSLGALSIHPVFFNFSTLSWQDRPVNQP